MSQRDAGSPQWAPSGKQDADSVLYQEGEAGQRELQVQRAVNIPGQDEPVIITQTVAVPHLPYVNMLDRDGNICPVVVSNNRVARQPSLSYRTAVLAHWRKKRWIRWDYLPEGGMEYEPAQNGLSAEQWYVRRDEIRRERAQRRAIEAQAFEVKPGDKDLAEAIKGNSEAITRLLARLIENQSVLPPAAAAPALAAPTSPPPAAPAGRVKG